MYRVTIRCWDVKPEELARELEGRTRRFKVWVYDKSSYASLDLKEMGELCDLRQKLFKGGGFNVDCIKVEKATGGWL